MKVYKCIKDFSLEKCDDNGFIVENEYVSIEKNSFWFISEEKEFRLIGGDIRLENHCGYCMEIPKETLEENFKLVVFYYENNLGDSGKFIEKDLIKAIYTAWNIEANLYLMIDGIEELVFCPLEDNEFNSQLLNDYGYYMVDGIKYREIVELKTNEVKVYEWEEVKQLV